MARKSTQFDALARALKLADPIERKKVARREFNLLLKAFVSPRPGAKPGPKPPTRKQVWPAAWAVMRELFPTIGGMGLGVLMDRTSEEVDRLPVDVWRRIPEGRTVFEREGEEGFDRWMMVQKKKHKEWHELHQMVDLYDLVERRMGLVPRKGRKHPRGGKFRQWVREAQDEFLLSWYGLTWENIPPHLRRNYRDSHEFTQRQMEYQFTHCHIGGPDPRR